MNKKTYTDGVRAALLASGVAVNEETLKRGIERAARHMRAKYGCNDWQMEHEEAGFDNGTYFYAEAEKDGGSRTARTFNRDRAGFGRRQ